MNNDLLAIQPHPTRSISEAASKDPEVISLLVGESPFVPPRMIIEKLGRDIERNIQHCHRYPYSRGIPALRYEIAQRYKRLYGLAIHDESQILVTNGATEAIWLSIFALTNPGDEVLIPDPCYMVYALMVSSLGRCPVRIQTQSNNGFILDPSDIKKAITVRTKLLLLNSPENPTGIVYPREILSIIVALAHEYNFYIVHDEVYDAFCYVGEYVPVMMFDSEATRIIMVNSLSKRFGMGGWRLGWMVASADVIMQVAKAHAYMNLSAVSLLQEAVVDALNDNSVEEDVTKGAQILGVRGLRFCEKLTLFGDFAFPAGFPQGGFYLFADVSELYKRKAVAKYTKLTIGETVAHYLLYEFKLAVIPGIGFGKGGSNFVRISFATSEEQISMALHRLEAILAYR